jgi:hypothetical protein
MGQPGAAWWYRLRWPMLTGWTAACLALTLRPSRPGIDWTTLATGARLLGHSQAPGGLHVYADNPSIQIGPLTLALVRLVQSVSGGHAALVVALISTALVLPTLALLERAVPADIDEQRRRLDVTVFIGGLFVIPAWIQATVIYAHPDDVLVAVCAVGALVAIRRQQPIVLGTMLAIAVAAKPTALVLVPLLLVLDGRACRRAAGIAAVGLACWLPFVLADSRTLLAGEPQTLVQPGSGLAVFGLAGVSTPAVVRVAQLALALLLGWVAVRHGRWAAVPLVGFAVRVAIDPGDFGYYAVGVVVAGLAWQVLSPTATRRRPVSVLPWAAVVAWLALSAPTGFGRWFEPHVGWQAQAVLRLVIPLTLVAAVLTDRVSQPDDELLAENRVGPEHVAHA